MSLANIGYQFNVQYFDEVLVDSC